MTTPASPERERADRADGRSAPGGYTGGVTDGNLSQTMDLQDFLNGVGTVFQLDRRRKGPSPKVQERVQEAHDAGSASRRRRLILATALLAAAAAGIRFWPRTGSSELPVAIRGLWTTSDPRYDGRSLLIAEREVSFRAPGQVTVHPVATVQQRQIGDTTYLTIEYLLDGEPVPWKLRLDPGRDPTLRLVNQPDMTWKRAGHER